MGCTLDTTCAFYSSSSCRLLRLRLVCLLHRLKGKEQHVTLWLNIHSGCDGLSDQSLIVSILSYFSFLPGARVALWLNIHSGCDGSSDQSLIVSILSYFSFQPGARCSSVVEHSLRVWWVVGSIRHSHHIELFLIPASATKVMAYAVLSVGWYIWKIHCC